MKSHKTPQKERGTYTYHFDNGTKVTIKPGEEGVTEEIIKQLHSLDDSEVYYNHKNWHRPMQKLGWTLTVPLKWDLQMRLCKGTKKRMTWKFQM